MVMSTMLMFNWSITTRRKLTRVGVSTSERLKTCSYGLLESMTEQKQNVGVRVIVSLP